MSRYQKALSKEGDESEIDEEEMQQKPAASGNSEKDALVAKPTATPPEVNGNGSRFSSGMFLRLTILVAVTLQNTSYALVRRYSRGHLKERYSTSSALLVMEVAKLFLSMWMVVFGGQESDVPDGSALSKYVFLIGGYRGYYW